MPGFSLRQAATEAGTSKSTILRAIQSGRLSATRTDDGGYAIDPAELFRVYPPKSERDAAHQGAHHGAGHDAPGDAAGATVDLRIHNVSLAARVEALEALLETEKRRAAEARSDMEHWRAQAERLVLPPPLVTPAPAHTEPQGMGGILRRLLRLAG